MMSMYQSSVVMSGYFSPTAWHSFKNLPSVALMMLALVTMDTRVLWFFLAKSYASSAMRCVPSVVVMVKSTEMPSSVSKPQLPRVYAPSVFSRKNVQSMPSSGTFTGRTLANRSSSLRMATLALSMLGHSSPARGVVVGPFRMTWQAFSSASTSSGMAFMWAARFSMVRPSISLNATLPLSTSSFKRKRSTRSASWVMVGPMPSPPHTPMTICGSAA